VPRAFVTNVVVATFNNLDSVELRFKQNRDQIAAVILEPIMMNVGLCMPQAGFLRRACVSWRGFKQWGGVRAKEMMQH
jgi:glutamate-1-semialdehyde 2,1-aminomutase